MNVLFIPVWLMKSDLLQSTTYQLCYIGKCFLSNARHSTKHVKHLPSWRGWIVNSSQTGGHLERYYLLDDPTDKLLLLQHCARYWTFLPLHHSSGHRYCVQHQNTCLHANKIYCQETHHSQHRTQCLFLRFAAPSTGTQRIFIFPQDLCTLCVVHDFVMSKVQRRLTKQPSWRCCWKFVSKCHMVLAVLCFQTIQLTPIHRDLFSFCHSGFVLYIWQASSLLALVHCKQMPSI